MLEALRGLGYSTAAALADIVDNSVSAGAREVRIVFKWAGIDSRISVKDDGRGMTDEELEGAMTLGDKSPLDQRDESDLGRFGMGLKTASFSQCRRLTVSTVRDGTLSCLRWDLDELAKDPAGGWLLFEGAAVGSEEFTRINGAGHGTLVLWEVLDRIVTPGYDADDFLVLIDAVEAHLAMVFHRMLGGHGARLRLSINDRHIAPWDPFMSGHPAKPWHSPIAKSNTASGHIAVECHVLPHKDKLTNAESEIASGPNGWNAQQGFYVYRNERLLVAGGWLGLGQGRAWNREEAYRLARIQLDIPNNADAAWKIDIRKSIARPPVAVRALLTKLAEDTRRRAREVFAFRGSPIVSHGAVPVEMAWRVERTKAGTRYRIDEKHPAVAAAIDASGGNCVLIRTMLKVVEATVPIQRIWLETAESKDTPRAAFEGEPTESVVEVLEALYEDMTVRLNLSGAAAKKRLLSTDPFQNYPTLVSALPDET